MLDKKHLYTTTSPWLLAVNMSQDSFKQLLDDLKNEDPHNRVILTKGKNMKDVDSLFSEFASALQFPDYFGENWNAFYECTRDLEWLSGENYIIAIDNIQDLLINEDHEELKTLIRILTNTCIEWSKPFDFGKAWGRQAKPFHFLLQYDDNSNSVVQERFKDLLDL